MPEMFNAIFPPGNCCLVKNYQPAAGYANIAAALDACRLMCYAKRCGDRKDPLNNLANGAARL